MLEMGYYKITRQRLYVKDTLIYRVNYFPLMKLIKPYYVKIIFTLIKIIPQYQS